MPRFFPRDVIQWRNEHLHPLRAFALSTLELAGLTGVLLRLYRAFVLGTWASSSWALLVVGIVGGVLFLCGMLTWHLGNFPLRRWPLRAALFVMIESAAEFGTSSLLISLKREPLGAHMATWNDWWPLAGQTLVERTSIVLVYSLVLAACVQLVRRVLDGRRLSDVDDTDDEVVTSAN
jgi:hypothetical protein